MTKVFISYSRKDLDFVQRLASDLKDVEFDVWYDLSKLSGGDYWASELQQAIDSCEKFLLIASPDSVRSEWVTKEFLYASNNKKRRIPLLYRNCKFPLWLQDLHYIDIRENLYQQNFEQILQELKQTVPSHSHQPQKITLDIDKIKYLVGLGDYENAYKVCMSFLLQERNNPIGNLFTGISYILKTGESNLENTDFRILENHILLAMEDAKLRSTALTILGCVKYETFELNAEYDPSQMNLDFIKEELQKTPVVNKEIIELITPTPYALNFLGIQ